MRLSVKFTFIIGLIMTGCSATASNRSVEIVSPEVFQTKLLEDSTAYLLDVRKPDEYAAGHLDGAHLLNWLDTDSFKHEAGKIDKSNTIYVYCRSGRRSNEAACYLADKGYNVVDMDGGILAWIEKNLPVVTESDDAIRQIVSQGIKHDSFKTQ